MKINIPSGTAGGGSGTVTSLTATAPVVVTPSPTTTTGVISAPTAVTSAAALTSNALVKGAGLQAAAASAVATDDGTTLTYTGTGGVLSTTSGGLKAGAAGGAAGVLSLLGSTSGTVTLTSDATAATAVINTVLVPDGAGTRNLGSTGARWASVLTTNINMSGTITGAGFGTSAILVTAANTSTVTWGTANEQLTLSTSGLTTDSVGNLLPANSIIEAVCVRVTTTITTTTNWAVGDPTTSARFSSANATLTSGTTSVGLNHMQGSVTTDAAGPVQTAAAKVRITCTGSNPGAGAVRIIVFYRTYAASIS